MTASPSFFFYDLETSGIDPRWHRIVQFAGVRTDLELNEIEPPITFYLKLPIDVLPEPAACAVTGLTPQKVNSEGQPELEAHVEIRRHLAYPGTCAVGFNNLRFDDEFVRHGFFRHFIDPYAREWQAGNSRWDIIDLVRATAALRPDGIEWPLEDGLPAFNLEALTAANQIDHAAAHDALSDVSATLQLARLLRRKQRRLFDFYLGMRRKSNVLELLSPSRPKMRLHVSGMFGRERRCVAPVLPIVRHPHNTNSIVVADLGLDTDMLLHWDAGRIRDALFTRGAELRPPLKEVRVNRCPFVAPISVLGREDQMRLNIDLDSAQTRCASLLRDSGLVERVRAVFESHPAEIPADADASLYQGFVADPDRSRCADVVQLTLQGEQVGEIGFDDARLRELLWRFRARRSPETLSSLEAERWRAEVKERLTVPGRGLTLAEFRTRTSELPPDARPIRAELEAHAKTVETFIQPARLRLG